VGFAVIADLNHKWKSGPINEYITTGKKYTYGNKWNKLVLAFRNFAKKAIVNNPHKRITIFGLL
jgi:hypothetical protein